MQVLCALNFYAGGSYQQRVGRDAHNYVSQSIVSRSIQQISKMISTNLGPPYIQFPQTDDAIDSVKRDFFSKYGLSTRNNRINRLYSYSSPLLTVFQFTHFA